MSPTACCSLAGKAGSVTVEPGARAGFVNEWATAVRALQLFLKAARVRPEQLEDQPHLADDHVEVALDAAMRALMFTDAWRSDSCLWSLISELMFNRARKLGPRDPESAGLWCPRTIRRELLTENLLLYWGPPGPLAVALDAKALEAVRLAKAYYDAVWPLCMALIGSAGFLLEKMLYTHLSDFGSEPTKIGFKPPRQLVMNAGCTAYCRWPECSSRPNLGRELRPGRRLMGISMRGVRLACSRRPGEPRGVVLLG